MRIGSPTFYQNNLFQTYSQPFLSTETQSCFHTACSTCKYGFVTCVICSVRSSRMLKLMFIYSSISPVKVCLEHSYFTLWLKSSSCSLSPPGIIRQTDGAWFTSSCSIFVTDQFVCRVQFPGTPWHCSSLSLKADTRRSKGCLTMSRLVTSWPLSRMSRDLTPATRDTWPAPAIICLTSEAPDTGATTRAWSLGWLKIT